jgi:uncharacterized protein (DUF1778 family)
MKTQNKKEAKVRISFRIDPEDKQAIEDICNLIKEKKSGVIRNVLSEYIHKANQVNYENSIINLKKNKK